ncbi:MAG TPA: type II toxin-antitoxin system prevent-host-death family antitoxin [Caulobacteraceae bacterium]|jgi:prevent-host-death family protein|nr:type II toxin-antitoxin system prevent-host-death family antitoxin [Caulobacteraceae bacterium]
MKQVNLYEAKTMLSALVDAAASGEEIVIAKNGRPRARLLAVESQPLRPMRWGRWDDEGWKLPDHFDAWSDELEEAFFGGPPKLVGER